MSRLGAWMIGALGAGIAAIAAKRARAPRNEHIQSSLDALSPVFRDRLEELLRRMSADGFDALVFETQRSPERAVELAERGAGVKLSQHTIGMAADVVDRRRYWKASPAFVAALHKHALELGLGRVEGDAWHVQALPPRFDARLRAMVPAARDAFRVVAAG